MPYIVTTKREAIPLARDFPHALPNGPDHVSRRAVATLEEAQDLVREAGATVAAAVITESGGTITLPDGSVIEVVPMDEEEMRSYASISGVNDAYERPMTEILDAYNARQA
jgi:hypothetical protein